MQQSLRKSVLNHVGHVGLVGHSRESFSWVKLVGQTRGSNSLVILGHSLPLVIPLPRAFGYSEIPKLPDNFS